MTDPNGEPRGYCDQHTTQMSNLTGWSRQGATRRTAGLWESFVSWCEAVGLSPFDPSAAMGFQQATGADSSALMALMQSMGPMGPIDDPGMYLSDELGGLPDEDLSLS